MTAQQQAAEKFLEECVISDQPVSTVQAFMAGVEWERNRNEEIINDFETAKSYSPAGYRAMKNRDERVPSHHVECGWKSCAGGDDCFERFEL